MASFCSQVLGRFPVGTKLQVFPRLGDRFSPGGVDPVETVKVPKSGDVKLTNLQDDAPYWLAGQVDGQWRATAFTATSDRFKRLDSLDKRGRGVTNAQALNERRAMARMAEEHAGLSSAAPGRPTGKRVVTGARSSLDVKGRHQDQLVSELGRSKPDDPEPRPALSQLDVTNVPQRSDTPFGQATPVDSGEPQPKPAQDDVKKKQQQRSDTPEGEATPKDKDEVEPALGQGDAPKRLKQMSDTPDGEVTPKRVQGRATKKAAVAAERERESSEAKASGEDKKPPEATHR